MSRKMFQSQDTVFFDVEKKPVFVDGNEVPGKAAIVNTDTGKVLSIMTDRFVPVSNGEIFKAFTKIADEAGIIWEPGKAHLIRGGAKTIMEIRFPNHVVTAKKGDILHLQGNLINGFDGFSAAHLNMGFLRLVCTNGAVIGESDLTLSFKHVGDINQKIISSFKDYLMRKLDTVEGFVKRLVDTKLESKAYVEDLFLQSTWLSGKYIPELEREWREAQKQSLSAWEVYNTYTKVITHDVNGSMEQKMLLYNKVNKLAAGWLEGA